MIPLVSVLLIVMFSASVALAQGKGVDKGSERVRDSASRAPASNGSKTDVGTGRGIDFGGGRTPEVPPIPNPYHMGARRDVILKAVQDVMRDRQVILNKSSLGYC